MPEGGPTASPRGRPQDSPQRNGSNPSSSKPPRSPSLRSYLSNSRNESSDSPRNRRDRTTNSRPFTNGNEGGDIELSIKSRRQTHKDNRCEGWNSHDNCGDRSMGGKIAKVSNSPGFTHGKGYEIVEREEPLLNGEESAGISTNRESVSARLLWNAEEEGSSLRSGGDHSLGPAYHRRDPSCGVDPVDGGVRRRAHESREALSLTRTKWDASLSEGSVRRTAGSSARHGRCTLSGRPLVYLCAFCSSLCSILLGYDVGVMSGAKEFIKTDLDLTSVQVETMVGALNLVAAFGGLLAGKAADRLGRKPTIVLACIVFILGAGMMTVSHSYAVLLVGRIVTGVGVGCAMVIAPVYITELAPPDVRGMLVSLTDICINLGILLGFGSTLLCMSEFESDSSRWRAMIGIGCWPPTMILLCLIVMPESPRWLIARGQDTVALEVLQRILDDDREAEESVRAISQATTSHTEASWRDVLKPTDKAVKAAMLLGVGLGFFQQASGSEAAVYYTPDVLQDHGWNQSMVLKGNIGVGVFKLVGEMGAFALLDRIGRRPLFVASSMLVTVCLVMVGMAFAFEWETSLVLFWLCMFMFSFSLGLGPVTFVVASEIFPVAIRGKAMSIVIFVNRLMSGIIASSFETLEGWISKPEAFYFFGIMSFLSIFFYFYKVPETRGRTLEEIIADLGSDSVSVSRGNRAGTARHVPLPDRDEELQ